MGLFFLIVFVLLLPLNVPTVLSSDSTSQEEWMGIYSGDDKIGHSYTLIKPTGEGGLEVFEETRLRMTVLGTEQDVEMRSNYMLSGYKLQAFEFEMNADSVGLKAKGEREGKELKIQMSSVSGKTDTSFPLQNEPLVSSIIYRWLSEQKPKVGKTYEIILFDPTSVLMGAGAEGLKTTLTVEGEERVNIPLGSFKTYRVKMIFAGSEITTWMTEKGEAIKEISPPGLVAVKETKEKALGEAISSLDIIDKTAISSDVSLDNPRGLKLLRVRIDGIESTEGLTLEDNNRQFYKDGLIEVKVGDISRINTYPVPYSDEEYKPYVEPSSLIQSDDQRVIRKAMDILEGEKDSLGVVRKINDWVYRNLEKAPTVSLPNALDVLKTGRGDCNEHAALFAALSRAAGVPTKIVLGVVFLDGKFYYHAWNEVFVGSWVAVDPTFGQIPADASHIKFIEGDLSKSSEIVKLVGNIKLQIKEAS